MRFLDSKFKEMVFQYIFQCIIAMIIIFFVLFLMDTISNMTIVASLGASTFIAMTMPHTNASRPRYLVGGYIVGVACGVAMNFLNEYLTSNNAKIFGHSPHIVTCAVAVGLAIFFMTMFNFEHPPAAALSMGLVLQQKVLLTAIIAVFSIILISIIKAIIKRWLIDLL